MPLPTLWPEALCFQSVCACASPEQTLLARYLGYFLMEFCQTFTTNGLWGKDEFIIF